MKSVHKIAGVVLVLLLGAAVYGIYDTAAPPAAHLPGGTIKTSAQSQAIVDQTPLKTAQQVAMLANTPEERELAKEALRLADHEVDLAFSAALHDAAEHPPVLNAAAKEIQSRLQKVEKALQNDQTHIAKLTAAEAKATEDKKDEIDDELDLAKAQQELDQDEVDDAKQDLIREGGDPQDRIQAMVAEHEVSAKATEAALAAGSTEPAEDHGLVDRVRHWWSLHQRQALLWRAKEDAESKEGSLSSRHNTLDAQVKSEKADVPDTSAPPAEAQVAPAATTQRPKRSREESKALVKATKARAVKQLDLATYDKRIDDEKELAAVYGKWIDLVAARQRTVLHRGLIGVAIILGIALIGLFFDGWIGSLVKRTALDRRQVETLHAVSRVSLQVVGVLLILLVIFGPPNQLGTFLGLAGAGLTVALKDFIVGFIGWFVLMGKNGIRLGDWVEINGVTGEVVELGMFHTVLLETGNWTDSGHPTGRRVTFTNGFAIEGHYFNFSTSGQWLWDELQIVLPSGQDPYPIVDAIQKKVVEATSESGRQAEQEWRGAARSGDLKSLSAAPAVNVKLVIGGTEIAVRYITRAHERYQARAKLNQIMVDLLGAKAPAAVVKTGAETPAKA
jgi:small-conductance mechanosensitive channel